FWGLGAENKGMDAVGSFIRIGNKLLMVQEHFEGHSHPRDLAFPGGTKEAGEKDSQAISRELEEETGLKLTRIGPHLENFGSLSLYACELNFWEKLKVFLRICLNGSYVKQGPKGERIRVTLVNPETLQISANGIEHVQEAYSGAFLPLAFKGQMAQAC